MSKLGHQIGVSLYDEASIEVDKFEKIGRLVAFNGLKLTAEVVDATQYADDAIDWSEFEYAMKDAGEVTLGIRYFAGNVQADALETALMDSTQEQIKILFPAAYNKRFILDVLVTSVEYATEKGGIKERTFTLKITGKPDIGAVT